jgi:hypothetical protein
MDQKHRDEADELLAENPSKTAIARRRRAALVAGLGIGEVTSSHR